MRSLAVLSFVASLAGSSMTSATAQETPTFDRFAWSVRREQAAFAVANLLVLNSRSALRAEEMAAHDPGCVKTQARSGIAEQSSLRETFPPSKWRP